MRTTLTLDEDVARLVEGAVHRERRIVKHVINDVRTALAPRATRGHRATRSVMRSSPASRGTGVRTRGRRTLSTAPPGSG